MKRISNIKMMRVADGFLPAALLIASLTSQNSPAFTLAICSLAVEALSLFSSHGVRIAFARQPVMRDVRGSVKCALLLTLAGAALAVGAAALFFKGEWARMRPVIAAGCLLNIEHIFYEYMYAIGDRRSASLSRGITAILTLAGLLLAGSQPLWIVGTAGLSAIVALVISLVMGDGTRGRPDATVARVAPRAAIQTALYPVAALTAILLFHPVNYSFAFFAGLALYELCKTPFRRSAMEAKCFNRALLIVIGLCALGTVLFAMGIIKDARLTILPATCAAVLIAAVCALGLYGNFRNSVE